MGPKMRVSYIDGIQTGNPDWECDTMTLRVRQTPYGIVNGELYLEMLSFDSIEGESAIDKVYPASSIALDERGARKLINALSLAFDIQQESESEKCHRRHYPSNNDHNRRF